VSRAGIALYAGLLALLGAGFLAAELGWFHPGWALGAGLIAASAVFVRRGDGHGGVDGWSLAVLAGAVVAMLFAGPPGEPMHHRWDPALYVQTGAGIAREGGFTFTIGDFASLPDAVRELLVYPSDPPSPFAGFVLNEDARLVPLFFHLFPVWIACLFSVGGIGAALGANLPLYALSGLLLFALVRRWTGPGWGVLAAVLLWILPPQLWQARFVTAELLAQTLLLGGFLFLDRTLAAPRPGRLDPLLAGLSFGMAFMTRVDTILPLAVLAVVLMPEAVRGERRVAVRTLFVALAIPVAAALLHVRMLESIYWPRPGLVARGALLVAVGLTGQALWLRTGARRAPASPWLPPGPRLAGVLAVAWSVWASWAWFIRPRLLLDGTVAGWVESLLGVWAETRTYAIIAGRDAWNMILLEQLVGRPWLAVALIVPVVALWSAARVRCSEARPGAWAWGFTVLGVTVVYLTALHHERAMMWMSRRFIPMIAPGLAVAPVLLLAWITARLRHRGARGAVLAGGLGLLVWSVAAPLATVAPMRDYAGTRAGFDRLALVFQPGDRVFADVTGVGASLRLIYGIEAWELNAPDPARRAALIDALPLVAGDGRGAVYFVTPIPAEVEQRSSLVLRDQIRFSARMHPQERMTLPRQTIDFRGRFQVYQVVANAVEGDGR
jgi:hypothetical protein